MKPRPRLIADGGEMIVGRRTAHWVYGQFAVTLPEGQTQQNPDDDRITDAFIYRPPDAGNGRAELTFVRADSTLDMNLTTSDLEDTLDQASRRVDGGTFYSSEIAAGLSAVLPEDVAVGDLCDVLVWQKWMTLPLTGITRDASAENPDDVRYQVGGQMVRDPESMRKTNTTLDAQIAREKAQRMRGDATNSRQVARVREALAGPAATPATVTEELQALTRQMQSHGELDEEAETLGLIPAYTVQNSLRWKMQEDIDRQQTEMLEHLHTSIERVKQENTQIQQSRPRRIIATQAGASDPQARILPPNGIDQDWSVQLPDSDGAIVNLETWEVVDGIRQDPHFRTLSPMPGGHRIGATTSRMIIAEWAQVSAIVKNIRHFADGHRVERDTWTKIWSFTTGATGANNLDLTAAIRWKKAWGYHDMEIRQANTTLAEAPEAHGSSGLIIKSPMDQTVSLTGVDVPAHQEISVWIRSRGDLHIYTTNFDNVRILGSYIERTS